MGTIDLSPGQMLAVYALLLLPLGLIAFLRLGLLKETFWGAVRMTVQLFLVGLYLKILFDLNSWLLSAAWMLVMLAVANVSTLRRAGLVWRKFFATSFWGTMLAAVAVTLFFVMGIIRPFPLYDARYLIPIFGMVLGNCMRGNVMSLERFYSGIRKNENEFVTRQLLGASVFEAVRPFMNSALRAAIGPHLATMTTMGIVSLPGMMTGQILGGALPMTAIEYQIAIMVCIFTVMITGAFFNLIFSIRKGFDEYGMLRHEIFTS